MENTVLIKTLANSVKAGNMTIDKVPATYKNDVELALVEPEVIEAETAESE